MDRRQLAVLVFAPVTIGSLALGATAVGQSTGTSNEGIPLGWLPLDPNTLLQLFALLAVITVLSAVYRASRELDRTALSRIAVAVVLWLAVVGGVFVAIEGLGYETTEQNETINATERIGQYSEDINQTGENVTENAGDDSFKPLAIVGSAFVLVGFVGILVAVGLLYFTRDQVAVPDSVAVANEAGEPDTAGDDEARLEAVGRAAGRAADRAADRDVENAVFQAWREMTDALDIDNPEATTPAEFAAVAIDAGMTPKDVRELTDVFEAVRYGDAEVTAERERRATEALRRIESTYSGGASSD